MGRKGQMQEGEAYGAGSDVEETPLRAEEKPRGVLIPGKEWEPSVGCSGGGEGGMRWGRGEMSRTDGFPWLQ